MTAGERAIDVTLSALGGAAGAFIGYQVFFWLVSQGFYGMMIPGALLGLGCGMLAREASMTRGVVCAVLGLALGLFTEWRFAPFAKDDSLGYMLAHLPDKTPVKLFMIALGGFFAFWLGKDGGFIQRFGRKPAPPRDVA
jgi:hypothetical protein